MSSHSGPPDFSEVDIECPHAEVINGCLKRGNGHPGKGVAFFVFFLSGSFRPHPCETGAACCYGPPQGIMKNKSECSYVPWTTKGRPKADLGLRIQSDSSQDPPFRVLYGCCARRSLGVLGFRPKAKAFRAGLPR